MQHNVLLLSCLSAHAQFDLHMLSLICTCSVFKWSPIRGCRWLYLVCRILGVHRGDL